MLQINEFGPFLGYQKFTEHFTGRLPITGVSFMECDGPASRPTRRDARRPEQASSAADVALVLWRGLWVALRARPTEWDGSMTVHRMIAHVDLDAFFASVEQVLNPSLAGRAVIVGGRSMDRGVVSSASYAAREFGVRSAMPLRQAHRLCRHGVFLPGNYPTYAEYSERVFEILSRFTPVIQPASIDEGYLDLTGTPWSRSGRARASADGEGRADWSVRLAEELRLAVRQETGLTVSVGLAGNKLVAKIATDRAKPDGVFFVRPGAEQAFLAELPLKVIPGLGRRTAATLSAMGLERVGDLAACPLSELEGRLGPAAARSLHDKANGRCSAPVQSDDLRVSIGRETTFARDTSDRPYLRAMLDYLSQRSCWKLRAEGLLARTVTVKLRYRDFHTVSAAHSLEAATVHDGEVSAVAAGLLDGLYRRPTSVRLIGVRLSGLTAGTQRQYQLWGEARRQKQSRLYDLADRIRDRFGFGAVATGRSLELMGCHEADDNGWRLHTPSLSR